MNPTRGVDVDGLEPFAGSARIGRQTGLQAGNDVGRRERFAVHAALAQAGGAQHRVDVGIDEARQQRLAFQVDHLGLAANETRHVGVGAHERHDFAGHRADTDDVAVLQIGERAADTG